MKWLCLVLMMSAVWGVARPAEICQKMADILRCARLDSVLRLDDDEVKEVRISYLSTGGRVIAPFAERVVIADTSDPAAACLSVVTLGRVVVKNKECSPRTTTSTTDRTSDFVWRTSTQATSITPKVTVEAVVMGTILGGVTGLLVMGFAIVCLCYNRHKRTPSSSAVDIDVISLNSLESSVIFDRHDKLA